MDCEVKNGGLKTVKNGPRVWAFCKIEFPGIQKPVHIFGQKSCFFRNPGNRGVGVIWWVVGGFVVVCFSFLSLVVGVCCFDLCCFWVFTFSFWSVVFGIWLAVQCLQVRG